VTLGGAPKIPELQNSRSRRVSVARKVSAAVLTEAKEERSQGRKVTFVCGEMEWISLITIWVEFWLRAAI